MDGTPDLYGENTPSPTVTGMLKEVQLVNGRSYAVHFDPMNAQFSSRSPVLVNGGGPEDYVYTPPVAGGGEITGRASDAHERQVVLVRREGKVRSTLSCVQHPQMKLEEKAHQPEDDEDHQAKISKQSFALRRAGIKAFVDENGALVIDTKDSNVKVVRLQLPDNGKLRVSRDGDAGGRLVLWHKLMDWIGYKGIDPGVNETVAVTLYDWAVNVNIRIRALEETVIALRETMVTPLTGATPLMTPAQSLEEDFLTWGEYSGEPDLAAPDVPDMNAAAIDVSKDVG